MSNHIWNTLQVSRGFPGGSDGKESAGNAETQVRSLGQESPLDKGKATHYSPVLAPVFLPEEFHGQRSPVDYSPWGRKESDTTEGLTLSPFFFIGKQAGIINWVYFHWLFYSSSYLLRISLFQCGIAFVPLPYWPEPVATVFVCSNVCFSMKPSLIYLTENESFIGLNCT